MTTTTSVSTMMSRNQELQANVSIDPRVWMERMAATKTAKNLAKIYSKLLESRVSPTTALHILHVQIAFCLLLLPVTLPTFVHVAMAIWTVLAGVNAWRSFREGGGRLR